LDVYQFERAVIVLAKRLTGAGGILASNFPRWFGLDQRRGQKNKAHWGQSGKRASQHWTLPCEHPIEVS